MTEDLRRFCNRLETLLKVMKHREKIEVNTIDSVGNKHIFNHTIRIEKIVLGDGSSDLRIDHEVCEKEKRVLIETFVYDEILILGTTYFYGINNVNTVLGADVSNMERVDRLRLHDEDSTVNFDELLEQMDLYAVEAM